MVVVVMVVVTFLVMLRGAVSQETIPLGFYLLENETTEQSVCEGTKLLNVA